MMRFIPKVNHVNVLYIDVFIVILHRAQSSSLSGCDLVDPCSTANTTDTFEIYARYENCPYDSAYDLCDRYITPTWYRFDDDILTHCPGLLSYGAIYPCWMNDSLPSVSDGVVTKTVCKVGFQNCCIKEYSIKVKHCGSYFSYCLPALDGCPERFCFGTNGTCEYQTTQASSTTDSSFSNISTSGGFSVWKIVLIVMALAFMCCLCAILLIIFKYNVSCQKRSSVKSTTNLQDNISQSSLKTNITEKKQFHRDIYPLLINDLTITYTFPDLLIHEK